MRAKKRATQATGVSRARACAMQVATLSSTGGEFHPTTQHVQDKVAEQGRDEEIARQSANMLAWPALRRRLDRIDPSYKN